jgi:hypothetical protein
MDLPMRREVTLAKIRWVALRPSMLMYVYNVLYSLLNTDSSVVRRTFVMSIEELFGPEETDSENDDEDEIDVPSDRDEDSDFEDGQPRTSPAGSDHEPEPDQTPTNENNVEEDGHINAEGVDYRQPRPPFLGCAWNGVRNAFIRTDELNTTRPRGSRPQGYIWVVSINGYRRTLAQTLADETRLTAQLAQRQRPQGNTMETLFGPDVTNNSLLEMTWYIGALGHDAPYVWFDRISAAWRAAVDMCGDGSGAQTMMAYERGERKELGHLQGISRCLTHEGLKERIRRWMRLALLLASGMYRAKIGFAFFTGQTWEFMGGYVQKDKGKPHYRFFAHPPIDEGALFVSLTHARWV